jgi:two-component system cell cycle response regulator CtrA
MTAIAPAAEVSRAAEGSPEWTILTGKLLVNLDTRFASVDGRPVHLTRKEYGILQLLCLRKGTIVTKQMFLDHLYSGMKEPHLKIIDVFVCKLRKKLIELTGGKDYIVTVWGRGYIFLDPAATGVITIRG